MFVLDFLVWRFEFVSDFEFRYSGFLPPVVHAPGSPGTVFAKVTYRTFAFANPLLSPGHNFLFVE
jgi:hypothetical protein